MGNLTETSLVLYWQGRACQGHLDSPAIDHNERMSSCELEMSQTYK